MPPVVTTRRRARKELSPGPWIAIIVVIIVVVTAYWWFTRPAGMTTDPAPETATPETPETAAPEDAEAPAETVDDVPPAGVDEAASAEAPAVDESEILTPVPATTYTANYVPAAGATTAALVVGDLALGVGDTALENLMSATGLSVTMVRLSATA